MSGVLVVVAILAAVGAVVMAGTLGHPIVARQRSATPDIRGQELCRLIAITISTCVSWCAFFLAVQPSARWTLAFEDSGGAALNVILSVIIGYYVFQIPTSLERRVKAFVDTYAFDLRTEADVRQKIVELLTLANGPTSEVYILSAAPVPLIELAKHDDTDEVFALLHQRVRQGWPTAFLTYSWLDADGHRDSTAGKFFQALAQRGEVDPGRLDATYRTLFARSLFFLNRLLGDRPLDAGADNILRALRGVHIRLLREGSFQFDPNSVSMSVIVRPNAGTSYSYVCISGTGDDLSDPNFLPIEGGAQPAAARRMLVEFNDKWRLGQELPPERRTSQQRARDEELISRFKSTTGLRTHTVDSFTIEESFDVFPVSVSLETAHFVSVTKCLLEKLQQSSKAGQKAHLVDLGCGTGAIGVACADAAASVVFVDILGAAVELSKRNWESNRGGAPTPAEFKQADAAEWVKDYLGTMHEPVLLAFNQPLYASQLNLFNLGSKKEPFPVLKEIARAMTNSPARSRAILIVSSSVELSVPPPETLSREPSIVTKPLRTDSRTNISVVAVYSHNSIWATAIDSCLSTL